MKCQTEVHLAVKAHENLIGTLNVPFPMVAQVRDKTITQHPT